MQRLARAMGGTPGDVTPARLIAWAGAQSWATETRRSVYASWRSFFRFVDESSLVEHLPRVRPAEPNPRPAPALAIRLALAASAPRVALMVRLGAEAGLRRGEIAQVHARDLVPDLGGTSLIVHGKGRRERIVPLTAGLAREVERAARGGWLFPGREGGHLSARRVGELMADALPGCHTAHTLRHAFATSAHAATGDLATVQDLLGHASPATTRRYIPRDVSRMRAAVEAIA